MYQIILKQQWRNEKNVNESNSDRENIDCRQTTTGQAFENRPTQIRYPTKWNLKKSFRALPQTQLRNINPAAAPETGMGQSYFVTTGGGSQN